MAADSCLVLYGNSVLLAGIKAELQSHGTLELITIEAGDFDASSRICALNPRAVIFDLGEAQPDFAVSLLRARPGVLLIGVDPSIDEMLP